LQSNSLVVKLEEEVSASFLAAPLVDIKTTMASKMLRNNKVLLAMSKD
jgi:hypothetical protein